MRRTPDLAQELAVRDDLAGIAHLH
jgi:hypothetical protein